MGRRFYIGPVICLGAICAANVCAQSTEPTPFQREGSAPEFRARIAPVSAIQADSPTAQAGTVSPSSSSQGAGGSAPNSASGWKVDHPTGAGVTRVTRGLDVLPNDAGQVWRTYDISPYVSQVRDVEHPEQAIIDWILRETGTDLWFHQPLGILTGSKDAIMVYHKPEIQDRVQEIIDRFVSSRGKQELFSFRLISVGNPNWREKAYSIMQPIDVPTAGIEAWLLSKENAALLLRELRKRGDFQQYNSPDIAIQSGQGYTLNRHVPRSYAKTLRFPDFRIPQGQLETSSFAEGFTLELNALRTLDGRSMECVIRCDIDQLEKMHDIRVDTIDPFGRTIPLNLNVPQACHSHLLERFRFPADSVLLVSNGVVNTPESIATGSKLPLLSNSRRADVLIMLECKGLLEKAEIPSTANLVQPNRR